MEIETDRLILRRWQSSDVDPFVSLNADPRVMQFFPATLSRAETEALISTFEERISQHGFGLWAAELKATAGFIGFIGLDVPCYPLPFSPCVEVGWRLAFDYWVKDMPKKEHVQPSLLALRNYIFRKSFPLLQQTIFALVRSWKESV